MNRSIILAIALAAVTIGCQSNPAEMTRLATFDGSDAQLHQLYNEHHCPLVVIGHGIYLPAAECLGQTPGSSAALKTNPAAAPAHAADVEAARAWRSNAAGASTAALRPRTKSLAQASSTKRSGLRRSTTWPQAPKNCNISASAEQRNLGGFAEEREIEGASIPIKCVRHGDGFDVLVPNGGDVQYFDGHSLHLAANDFVPLK